MFFVQLLHIHDVYLGELLYDLPQSFPPFLKAPPGARMLEINVHGGKFKFSHRANISKVKYHKVKNWVRFFFNPIFFLPENVRVLLTETTTLARHDNSHLLSQVVSQQEALIRNEVLP